MRSYHLFLVLLFFSCEKQITETIEVEKVTSWTQLSQVSHEKKIIYNSETDSTNLYFIGENYFIKMNFLEPTFYYRGSQTKNMPVMSSKYTVDIDNTVYYKSGSSNRIGKGIKIIINQNPGQLFVKNPSFAFQEFDSTLSPETEIFASSYFTNPIGYISNQDYFITLVHDPSNNSREVILICKINVVEIESFLKKITLIEKRAIDIPIIIDKWYAYAFFQTGDDFIVSANRKTYFINQLGNINIVLEKSFEDIVSFENKLYAISMNELFVSSDKGHNWISINNNIPLNSKFFLINNSLGFFVDSQLLIYNPITNKTNELKNDGLESNRIVSVKKYNNQVYVSTLSGIFYKNVNSFFDNKPIMSAN